MREAICLIAICCAAAAFCAVESSKVELSRYYGQPCDPNPVIPHGRLKDFMGCWVGRYDLTCLVLCDPGYYTSLQFDAVLCRNGTWDSVECLPFAGPPPQKYCQLSATGLYRRQTPLKTLHSVKSAAECAQACVDDVDCMASLFQHDQRTAAAPSPNSCTLYLQAGPLTDPCPAGVQCTNYMCIDQRPPPKQCPVAAQSGRWLDGTVLETLVDDARVTTPDTCQTVCERNSACKAATYIMDETVFPAQVYKLTCILYSSLNSQAMTTCPNRVTCRSFSC